MLFHTVEFFYFLVFFSFCWFPLRGKLAGRFILLMFSSVFYAAWDYRFLPLIWTTIVVDYYISKRLSGKHTSHRKVLLTMSLALNLSILGIFKYWNFIIDIFGWVHGSFNYLHIQNMIIPVGVSFYTFQSMSFIIDAYRRKEKCDCSLWDYASYVSFFPQLVAGPIERKKNLLPQIINPPKFATSNLLDGFYLFSCGFARKAVGDLIALRVDPIFANIQSASPNEICLAIIGFSFQIYFDFSGYTDMARGVARVMGINLMINFRTPYFAKSCREFWTRWHISLSTWIRDYLYISLGGNRHGLARHLGNLLFTMMIAGLWHGAGANFIIWGFLHGSFLVTNVLYADYIRHFFPVSRGVISILEKHLCRFITFAAVTYAWIYFRVPTMNEAITFNAKLFQYFQQPSFLPIEVSLIILVLIMGLLDLYQYLEEKKKKTSTKEWTIPSSIAHGVVAGFFMIMGIFVFNGTSINAFIYFQF